MVKITVIRKTPTREVLLNVYDTFNKLVKNPKCFYTTEQLEELKKDKTNVWL